VANGTEENLIIWGPYITLKRKGAGPYRGGGMTPRYTTSTADGGERWTWETVWVPWRKNSLGPAGRPALRIPIEPFWLLKKMSVLLFATFNTLDAQATD
jgi:hypothetical protein